MTNKSPKTKKTTKPTQSSKKYAKSAVHKFIEDERGKGSTDQEIQHKLLDAGWQMDIIQHTMDQKTVDKLESTNTLVGKPVKPVKSSSGLRHILSNPVYAGLIVLLAALLIALFI